MQAGQRSGQIGRYVERIVDGCNQAKTKVNKLQKLEDALVKQMLTAANMAEVAGWADGADMADQADGDDWAD